MIKPTSEKVIKEALQTIFADFAVERVSRHDFMQRDRDRIQAEITKRLAAFDYVIVPKEPTEAMRKAVHPFILRTRTFAPEKFGLIYKTMIEAAEKQGGS